MSTVTHSKLPRPDFIAHARAWLTAGTRPEWLILALAALLRFWRLGYHSVWFDEAVSLRWAGSDMAFTWQKTFPLVEEKHPPAYYLLLHGWQRLLEVAGLGHSDTWLRASGSLLGVLTVAGMLLLVRRLSGRRVALATGLLVALAPVLVWYSQELRMFQPATTGLVWGGYALLRAWQSASPWRRLGWWALMASAFLLALYSYLFSAFMLPAAGLTLLALWAAARGAALPRNRRLLEGIGAFALVALLFLPLARNGWLVNAGENTPGAPFAHVAETTLRLLRVFSVWKPGWPEWLLLAAAGLTGVLFLLGVLLPRWYSEQPPGRYLDRTWIALWVGVPWLVGNLLLATTDSVFGEDRYFLFLAPFMLWGAARGAVALGERWQPASWATGGALVLALVLALPVLWTPAMHRENWRAAARLIAQQRAATPDLTAAVLSHVDYTNLPAKWYLEQYPLDLPIFYPFGGALDPAQVETQVAPPLEGLAANYDTLWLLQSHLEGVDDSRLVEQWLAARYPLITEAYPAGIKLTGYALQSRFDGLPLLGPDALFPRVEAAPGLTLVACELLAERVGAQDTQLHPPSGWLPVHLWWQRTGEISGDYVARVRVANAEGVWGESLGREGDALRRMPTSQWTDDAFVRNTVDVNLNPTTPPGIYQVSVRALDAAGAEAGPEVGCGSVVVED
jgi:4-amino-4-deoxy-L-arabinose transferase-like glycosyltransferase